MKKSALMALACLSLLSGCGRRTVQINLVPVEDRLTPRVIESDDGWFVEDRIALIDVGGLLMNLRSSSPLSPGSNPVSDFREALAAAAKDPSVKALVLRLNTPGGGVTASDMMYRDLLAFKKKTGKPVVIAMLDVCASGGFYLSCGGDYRIAYPSTITGSIGVIVQTINFSGSLGLLGIRAEAIKSGANKDMASPLRPMTDQDRQLLQGLVEEFYGQFLQIVKESHPKVAAADWPRLTDGRVITGREAARVGLVDEVGDLDRAIAKARELSGVKAAKIVTYRRSGEAPGSVYAQAPAISIPAQLEALLAGSEPQFFYLWKGQ